MICVITQKILDVEQLHGLQELLLWVFSGCFEGWLVAVDDGGNPSERHEVSFDLHFLPNCNIWHQLYGHPRARVDLPSSDTAICHGADSGVFIL